jgi:hypothetical protein
METQVPVPSRQARAKGACHATIRAGIDMTSLVLSVSDRAMGGKREEEAMSIIERKKREERGELVRKEGRSSRGWDWAAGSPTSEELASAVTSNHAVTSTWRVSTLGGGMTGVDSSAALGTRVTLSRPPVRDCGGFEGGSGARLWPEDDEAWDSGSGDTGRTADLDSSSSASGRE